MRVWVFGVVGVGVRVSLSSDVGVSAVDVALGMV